MIPRSPKEQVAEMAKKKSEGQAKLLKAREDEAVRISDWWRPTIKYGSGAVHIPREADVAWPLNGAPTTYFVALCNPAINLQRLGATENPEHFTKCKNCEKKAARIRHNWQFEKEQP